jgi:hypothetical protein
MRPPIFSRFLIATAVIGETPVASAQSPTRHRWCARTYKTDGDATSCYFTPGRTWRHKINGYA